MGFQNPRATRRDDLSSILHRKKECHLSGLATSKGDGSLLLQQVAVGGQIGGTLSGVNGMRRGGEGEGSQWPLASRCPCQTAQQAQVTRPSFEVEVP